MRTYEVERNCYQESRSVKYPFIYTGDRITIPSRFNPMNTCNANIAMSEEVCKKIGKTCRWQDPRYGSN